ncbi:hypothetical protein [Paenibacillus sp. KN14-4R]|uniref:hypothetical protein n=1 Tax=Paenibacillus sp. KN14-4R TaxID=3445773 RepID=UPI003FA12B47
MNEEMKKACAILGVPEDATKQQIEDRYGLLLKKARSHSKVTSNEQNSSDTQVSVDEINEAYNRLMGLDQYVDDTAMKPTGKVEHFFYYHKMHVFIAILLIIGAVFGVKSFLDRQAEKAAEAAKPPIDVSVMFFGDYRLDKPDKVSDVILPAFPEWKRVETALTIALEQPKDSYEMALQQKSVISMMSDRSDVYIMDRHHMEAYVKQSGFIPLDELTSRLPSDLLSGKMYVAKTDKEPQEHVYAVDVSNSSFFKSIPINDKEKYALIRFDTTKKDKALQLVEWLIRSTKP